MTRSIKAFEKAKRVTTCQDVEQKFLRIVHRDQTENRVT
jgi:hypothetical protein